MDKAICPNCAREVPLQPGDLGRLIQCADCGTQFRVAGGGAVAQPLAPAVESPRAAGPERWYVRLLPSLAWGFFSVGTVLNVFVVAGNVSAVGVLTAVTAEMGLMTALTAAMALAEVCRAHHPNR